jgi:hypothetical protein
VALAGCSGGETLDPKDSIEGQLKAAQGNAKDEPSKTRSVKKVELKSPTPEPSKTDKK